MYQATYRGVISKEQGDDGEKEGAQASLACDNDVETSTRVSGNWR